MTGFLEVVAPVALLIAAGAAAARAGLIASEGLAHLSRLAFSLFLPALLFRAMAVVDLAGIGLRLPAVYFSIVVPFFLLLVYWRRSAGDAGPIAVSHGLDAVFSNTVMLGIPLVRLAWGEAGLARLLTVIMFHALVLLGLATVWVESLSGQQPSSAGQAPVRGVRLQAALRSAVLNPIVVPIALGALWSVGAWPLPDVLDRSLLMMGAAASPLCLVLLGASVATQKVGVGGPVLLCLCLCKSVLLPLAVALGASLYGLAGLDLAVLTMAAAMPAGTNVFLFAQRYQTDPATAGAVVSLTSLFAVATVPLVLWLLGRFA